MTLFLPQHAWLVSLTDDALAESLQMEYGNSWIFDGPGLEILIHHPFDPNVLRDAGGDPHDRVRR